MRRAHLGRSDLEVSTLVFGSMGRSRQTGDERRRVLDAAIDAGLTSIDTAPLYDFGEVEAFLGRALAGRRERVELLGKVGLRWDDAHGEVLFETHEGGRRRTVRRDSRPIAIRRDVEESLTRLRTDHLDLCQIHHPDRRVPLDDALGELERLRDEGKIRHIGVSNVEPHELARCLDHFAGASDGGHLASLQLHLSLLERRAEDALLPAARGAGAGILAYTPLEAGALTARLLEDPAWVRARGEHDPVFRSPNLERIRDALVESVVPVARDAGTSVSAICLACLLSQQGVSAAIVGASSEAQIAENRAAWDVALSAEIRASIRERFAAVALDRAQGVTFGTRVRRRLGRLRERMVRLAGAGGR